MTDDGKIQYDHIIESTHPAVKGIVVAALDQCRNIKGKFVNIRTHCKQLIDHSYT